MRLSGDGDSDGETNNAVAMIKPLHILKDIQFLRPIIHLTFN